jgi:formylmethanofuran dehydrogenase subunit E
MKIKSRDPREARSIKTLQCTNCPEKVNVDSQTVSVVCWRCVMKRTGNFDKRDNRTKKKED